MIEKTSKINVNLSDYPYQKDMALRLLISQLTVFEVHVIQEILHSSLTISISELARTVSVDRENLLPVLEKLLTMELFHLKGDSIVVDKQMRKYYTFQMEKFSRNFRPDIEFLRKFLQRIPIDLLPVWYTIPPSSNDIFSSIIDQFLRTPKIYQRHLNDLRFSDPRIHAILKDVHEAPDFKVRTKTLLDKYGLSREQFEEYLLLLEFHLACCSSYEQRDGEWDEVITPFFEWRAYRRLLKDRTPKTIPTPEAIQRIHPDDFGFIQDMNTLLTTISGQPLSLHATSPETVRSLFSSVYAQPLSDFYLHSLLGKLQHFHLAAIDDRQHLCPCEMADTWLQQPLEKQAFMLYKHAFATTSRTLDRSQREIERCLTGISGNGWMYVEDFVKGCAVPMGNHPPVTLQKTGKRWSYRFPVYTSEDVETLNHSLFQNLFCAGIIAKGVHRNKPCFCLTPFGHTILRG